MHQRDHDRTAVARSLIHSVVLWEPTGGCATSNAPAHVAGAHDGFNSVEWSRHVTSRRIRAENRQKSGCGADLCRRSLAVGRAGDRRGLGTAGERHGKQGRGTGEPGNFAGSPGFGRRSIISLTRPKNVTRKLGRSRERIGGVVIERAYLIAVKAFVFDLKIDAAQQRRWKLFDRKADRLRCRVEAPILHRPSLAVAGGKELRWRVVIEAHRQCTRIARSRCETKPTRAQARSRAPPAREARRPS